MDKSAPSRSRRSDSRSNRTISGSKVEIAHLLKEIQTYLDNEKLGVPDPHEKKALEISHKVSDVRYTAEPWPTPPFQVGETVEVLAHNLKDLKLPLTLKFRVNDPRNLQRYKQVTDSMELFYATWLPRFPALKKKLILKPKHMIEKNICVGLIQNVYKRVAILKTPQPEDSLVNCYLVDEGTEAETLPSDLILMARGFVLNPPMILEFRLNGLHGFVNSDEIIPQLKQLDLTGDLTATILEAENYSVYKVTLHSPKFPGRPMNDRLLERLFYAYDPRVRFPEEGAIVPRVFVSNADSLGNVYINMPNPVEEFMDAILEKITDEEFEKKAGFHSLPSRSMLCISIYKKEYCRVFCVDELDGRVRVEIIDYGGEIEVGASEIAFASRFDRNLRKIPPQAIMVHLDKVACMNDTAFMAVFETEELEMKVVRRTASLSKLPEVELFQCGTDAEGTFRVSINQTVLVTPNFSKPAFPETTTGPSNVQENATIPLDEPSVYLPRGIDWGKGNEEDPIVLFTEDSIIEVVVTRIECMGEIYVKPANLKVDISAEIARVWNSKSDPVDSITLESLRDSGKYASYKNSADGTYGRGQLLKSTIWNHKLTQEYFASRVGIFDVDLQQFVFVPAEDIQQLEMEVAEILPQGARVLWINPDNLEGYLWTGPEWDGFAQYAVGKRLQMKIITLAEKGASGLEACVTLVSEDGNILRPETGFGKVKGVDLD